MIKLGAPSRYQLIFDWFCTRPQRVASARDVRRALPDICDASAFSVLLGQCAREHKFLTQPQRGLYQFKPGAPRPTGNGWKSGAKKAEDEARDLEQRVVHLRLESAPVVIDPILSAPLIRRLDRCAHR